MTDFKTIPLSEIHPDKNQPRKFFDDNALKELTESIKNKGVLQPIMVRPNGKGYILVCGERRYKASTAAGLKDVPAVIRTLTDEEALEIQFIENIQRDDVHPMDEATTFKSMLESKIKPYTVADIAAKINKPPTYIVQRMVLNNLLPSLQKDFWGNKFLIGQAVLIARLSLEDQKKLDAEARDWQTKEIKSIPSLKQWIESNIEHKLSAAPFKKDDPALNPAMGPCTTCPFRSGNNPTLFNDVKDMDTCFKPACFEIKMKNHLIFTVKDVIENKPEIHLLSYGSSYKILPEIEKLMKENTVKALRDYEDYSTYDKKGNIKARGLFINSHSAGKFETIYLKNKNIKTSDGKPVLSVDMDIAGIKVRTKRAAELDDEKVWSRIHSEIININTDKSGLDINMKMITDKKLSNIDTAAAIYAMYERAGSESAEVLKIFGFKDSHHLWGKEGIDFSEKLLTASNEQFYKVCRIFAKGVLDSATSSHSATGGLAILKKVAEQYYPKEITSIELEQKEKQIKREERAAVRIKALQEQKKDKPVKISPAKKVEAPVKKGKGLKALLK